MRKDAVNYLLKNYYMRKDEFDIFRRLIQLKKGEEMTVPTTPWIDKMSVYRKGKSIKAFLLTRRDLYSSTFMANPELLQEGKR